MGSVTDSELLEDAQAIWFWAMEARQVQRDQAAQRRPHRELANLQCAAERAIANGEPISDELHSAFTKLPRATITLLCVVAKQIGSEFKQPIFRVDARQLRTTIAATRARLSHGARMDAKDECARATFETALRATGGTIDLIPSCLDEIRGEPLRTAADLLKLVEIQFSLAPLASWARCAKITSEIKPHRAHFRRD